MPVPSQESEWSFIYVLWISILSLSTIFLLDCGVVLTVWYLLLSFINILIHGNQSQPLFGWIYIILRFNPSIFFKNVESFQTIFFYYSNHWIIKQEPMISVLTIIFKTKEWSHVLYFVLLKGLITETKYTVNHYFAKLLKKFLRYFLNYYFKL